MSRHHQDNPDPSQRFRGGFALTGAHIRWSAVENSKLVFTSHDDGQF
jgi:hypothetical protein